MVSQSLLVKKTTLMPSSNVMFGEKKQGISRTTGPSHRIIVTMLVSIKYKLLNSNIL